MTVTGIQTFADLKGKRVGAWGGSIVTAKGVSAMTGVPYQIVTMKDQPSAIAALNAGQVDAVLAVVGQPATWVKGLSELNMVPVPSNAKLSAIYAPAKLFYPNLSAQSVSTISVQIMLATRDFKTAEKKQLLLAYQKCAIDKLVNLQEDEGMHPKWQEVNFKTWPWPQYN